MARLLVLVGTRKGLFVLASDIARRHWTIEGPHFLGQVVNHAVLDPRDGRTLLGMHIAGWAGLDPHGHFLAISYMIPAWQLFSARNYGNTSSDEVWTLVRRP